MIYDYSVIAISMFVDKNDDDGLRSAGLAFTSSHFLWHIYDALFFFSFSRRVKSDTKLTLLLLFSFFLYVVGSKIQFFGVSHVKENYISFSRVFFSLSQKTYLKVE